MKLQIVKLRNNHRKLLKLHHVNNHNCVGCDASDRKNHPNDGVCDLHGLFHGEKCDRNYLYKNIFYKLFSVRNQVEIDKLPSHSKL